MKIRKTKLKAPEAVKENKGIHLNWENIEAKLKGTCPICGKPWDLGKYYEEFLLEDKKYGIIHEECVYEI